MPKIKAVYKPKTLFSGAVIGRNINEQYVAVPDHYKENQILVLYKDERMIIDEWSTAETYRTFEDKFKRNKNYTLGYFKFIPESAKVNTVPEQISLI